MSATPRVDSSVSRDPSYESPHGPKSVGAYYTPAPAARALSDWAIRDPGDRVLDPSAGDGVFLQAAARRQRQLGADAARVTGIEVRAAAVGEAAARLRTAGVNEAEVRHADFLALPRPAGAPFDVVLGNPPYVRFQRLDAAARLRARQAAAGGGVDLDPLASSWAPFVVHASAFLRPGGRLALVLPSEIGHARYARGVLEHLRRSFAEVTFVLLEASLFPDLDQGTVLLLAEGHARPFRGFYAAGLASMAELADGLEALPRQDLDADALVAGRTRLHHARLPSEAARLLGELAAAPAVTRLGRHARVSIGYVTGHNAFFHLSPERAVELGLEPRHLRPAVFRGRALAGLELDRDTWCAGTAGGLSGYLLMPDAACAAAVDDPAVAAYLAAGEAQGVPLRAKVRRRAPWYRVTRTAPPDLILTAMSGGAPRLAVNTAGASVCNTLHAVTLRRHDAGPSARSLALAALTSLAELSAEVEGHALGGGLLKLEPSEALRLLLPLPAAAPDAVARALDAADRALRAGDRDAARRAADRVLLDPLPGVGSDGSAILASAAARLRELRRRARRRRPAA